MLRATDSKAEHPVAQSAALTGPSRGAESGTARQLVVLLHGLGADGADLIALAPLLARTLPDAAFVAPDAPFPCDMAAYGRQWFSVQDRSPGPQLDGVRHAETLLGPFIDRELGALDLGADKLIVIGFSQGTMMALHHALRRETAPLCIIGYSGRMVAPALLATEGRNRAPVLLVHGDADEVVSPDNLKIAAEALDAAGIPVDAHMVRGLGHGIDERCIALADAFLRKVVTG